MTRQRIFIMIWAATLLGGAACSNATDTPVTTDGDTAETPSEAEEIIAEQEGEVSSECNSLRFPGLGTDCEAYYGCYGKLGCNDDNSALICIPDADCPPPPADGDDDPDVADSDPDAVDTDPDAADTDPDVVDTDPDPVDTDPGTIAGCRVLFDNAHAQTAGNADWTISGGFSDFADALDDLQMVVDEWGNDESSRADENDAPITYSELSRHDVYIIPEPNVPFTRSEQQAIARFVQEGGGVFIIADHSRADRNNDGWDAVEIFNGFQSREEGDLISPHSEDDEFVPKYFGVTFIERSFSMEPITDIRRTHPVTQGVYTLGMWSGTTMQIDDSSRVTGLAYLDGESFKGPFVAVSSYGTGKVVLLGDSSLGDDGTGASGDDLYDGWSFGDDSTLHVNAAKWLCR